MGRPKGSKNKPKTEDIKVVEKPVKKGRPAGSKNKPKVEPKKKGRAKRPWHIDIFGLGFIFGSFWSSHYNPY